MTWTLHGQALDPTSGTWDARGARITSVLPSTRADNCVWTAFYDGRASSVEIWYERTEIAVGDGPGRFAAVGGPTPAGLTARYLSVVQLRDGVRLN